jgi:hypothetical protein
MFSLQQLKRGEGRTGSAQKWGEGKMRGEVAPTM